MEKSGQRFKTYFAKWGTKQVNLSALVVHPDFRRRGGGSMLVNWGIARAEERGWPVTLCASPMRQLLYKQLGFETIAIEVVQWEGEEESLESTVMVFPAKTQGVLLLQAEQLQFPPAFYCCWRQDAQLAARVI